MSLMTLIQTKDIVRDSIFGLNRVDPKKFDNITDRAEAFYKLFSPNISKIEASHIVNALHNLYNLQYQLINTYYNKSTVTKVCHSEAHIKEIGIKKALEYYYQHQFLHNNTAIIDEVYEQKDALSDKNSLKFDNEKSFLLFIEETIDVLHFAIEYGCLFAEHAVLLEYFNNAPISEFPSILYTNADFKQKVLDKIRAWLEKMGNLKNEDIIIPINMVVFAAEHTKKYYASSNDEHNGVANLFDGEIMNVRRLIRKFAFKDWKVYPEDFYNEEVLFKLFSMSTFLLLDVIEGIAHAMELNKDFMFSFMSLVLETEENMFHKYNKQFIFDFMYGCYVAKNWVNRQRQKEDPRYTGKHFGKIIGVDVIDG